MDSPFQQQPPQHGPAKSEPSFKVAHYLHALVSVLPSTNDNTLRGGVPVNRHWPIHLRPLRQGILGYRRRSSDRRSTRWQEESTKRGAMKVGVRNAEACSSGDQMAFHNTRSRGLHGLQQGVQSSNDRS